MKSKVSVALEMLGRINDRYNQSLSTRENEMPKSKGQRSADDDALSITQSNTVVSSTEMRQELHDCSQ